MVNKIRRQSKVKEENFNDNTILEEINKRREDGGEYDRGINIKSFRLEGKSKEKTTDYGRVRETAKENI